MCSDILKTSGVRWTDFNLLFLLKFKEKKCASYNKLTENNLVSAITHDLRTPLAIIQGHVEGLQEGLKYDSEKLDTYLDIISQNTDRAKKLILDMNELSEIDCQGFTLNKCSTDP